jgi:hypothetical protein
MRDGQTGLFTPFVHLVLNFPDGTRLNLMFVEERYLMITGAWARRPAIAWQNYCGQFTADKLVLLRSLFQPYSQPASSPNIRDALTIAYQGTVISTANAPSELSPGLADAVREATATARSLFPKLLEEDLLERHPVLSKL